MTMYGVRTLIGGQLGVSDAHGGCGSSHQIEAGPSGYAELTCAECEGFLRTDRLWSATVNEVPETYDERLARESAEKRGHASEQHLTRLALAKLAGVDGVAMFGTAGDPGFSAACPQGHPCPASAKFCGTCGSAIAPPVAALPGTTRCEDGHECPVTATFCETCGKPVSGTAKTPAAEKTPAKARTRQPART